MSERILQDDWITEYVRFTKNTESPRQYHLWVAISAIASALQKKCWIDWGHETIYPNMYIALVGPPGGRKGTSMKIAKQLVHALEIPMGSDSVGSAQALYKELMDAKANFIDPDTDLPVEHRSISIWSEEFQVFLGDNDMKLLTSLTDLFDNPLYWEYSTLKRGKENLSNCWINLLGAITPSLLQNNLSRAAVGGGLISRIVFVVGYGKEKHIPWGILTQHEKDLQECLVRDLEQIHHLRGPFSVTEKFIEEYSQWYINHSEDSGIDMEKFSGYNSRRALHLRKLCMLISAAESNKMIINANHFRQARAILEYTEQEMPNAFYGLGKGSHAEVMADIMRLVQQEGVIDSKALYRYVHMDVLPSELNTCLIALEQSDKIKLETTTTGRTMVSYKEVKKVDKTKILNDTVFKHLDD